MPRNVDRSASSLLLPKPFRSLAAKAARICLLPAPPGADAKFGKISQPGESFTGGDEIGKSQRLGRRKRKRTIQQHGVNLQPGLNLHAFNARLADPVPILQRCFGVALQEIDGCQEVRRIGIIRLQPHAAPKPLRRVGVTLLPKSHAAEFDRESRIVRPSALPRQEDAARLIETSRAGPRPSRCRNRFPPRKTGTRDREGWRTLSRR